MTEPEQPDPLDAPLAAEPGDKQAADSAQLKADDEEPDVEPFAGDDDILAGHLDDQPGGPPGS